MMEHTVDELDVAVSEVVKEECGAEREGDAYRHTGGGEDSDVANAYAEERAAHHFLEVL